MSYEIHILNTEKILFYDFSLNNNLFQEFCVIIYWKKKRQWTFQFTPLLRLLILYELVLIYEINFQNFHWILHTSPHTPKNHWNTQMWGGGGGGAIRNPRETPWDSYKEALQGWIVDFLTRHRTENTMELSAEFLQGAITSWYENNCPIRKTIPQKGIRWWNTQLESRGREVRELLNRAQKNVDQQIWEKYYRACRKYNIIYKVFKRTSGCY